VFSTMQHSSSPNVDQTGQGQTQMKHLTANDSFEEGSILQARTERQGGVWCQLLSTMNAFTAPAAGGSRLRRWFMSFNACGRRNRVQREGNARVRYGAKCTLVLQHACPSAPAEWLRVFRTPRQKEQQGKQERRCTIVDAAVDRCEDGICSPARLMAALSKQRDNGYDNGAAAHAGGELATPYKSSRRL